ncbi:Di-copper centre-containing protein [Choiromyces venosus 120613-1]|uniref:Di-copper centre-containing protein n=1 Tax=Choiromyces venosus 120613-1 TaxID=1336337 RepID=A0A3N4JQA7_9PEZI|nr:Di-copper centre-containing protein [Choiromyces venosus 120613-1]
MWLSWSTALLGLVPRRYLQIRIRQLPNLVTDNRLRRKRTIHKRDRKPLPESPRPHRRRVRPGRPFQKLHPPPRPYSSIRKNPQCLRRDFVPSIAALKLTKERVRLPHCEKNFGWYDWKVQEGVKEHGLFVNESSFHAAGHASISGEAGQMSDVYASPGDPIFYLHHASVDRQWWMWQNVDRKVRLKDATGPIIVFDFPFGNHTRGKNITLDFEFGLLELAPLVPLGRVMDTQGDLLCYIYAKEKAVYDPRAKKWFSEEVSGDDYPGEGCRTSYKGPQTQ